jgi:hypothetical protein
MITAGCDNFGAFKELFIMIIISREEREDFKNKTLEA